MAEIFIREAPEVQAIAAEVMAEAHPDLTSARVLYVITNGKAKCRPKLLNAFERYLSSGDRQDVLDGYDLVVVLNDESWDLLRATERERAYLDHVLSHVNRVVDDDGSERWEVTTAHPLEEFPEVVARHGLYHPGLRDLARLTRQLPLPDVVPASPPPDDGDTDDAPPAQRRQPLSAVR